MTGQERSKMRVEAFMDILAISIKTILEQPHVSCESRKELEDLAKRICYCQMNERSTDMWGLFAYFLSKVYNLCDNYVDKFEIKRSYKAALIMYKLKKGA